MKKLTLDILDAISPEYAQYQGILPFTARYNEYTSQFSLNNQAWENHFNSIAAITFNWQEIKYGDVVKAKFMLNEYEKADKFYNSNVKNQTVNVKE